MHDALPRRACDSPLSAADVRVRLIVTVAVIVAVVAARRLAFPLAALAGSLALLAGLRTPARTIARRLLAPAGLVIVLVALKTLLTGGPTLAGVSLFGWRVAISRPGLIDGLHLGGRVLACVAALLTLAASAPSWQLFACLRWCRVPAGWIDIAVLMYRYIFLLREQVGSVRAAQRLRLGYAGWGRSLGSTGRLAGCVILRAVDQAERTHDAMQTRCWTGSLQTETLPPLGRRAAAGLLLCLAAIAVAFVVAERWLA